MWLEGAGVYVRQSVDMARAVLAGQVQPGARGEARPRQARLRNATTSRMRATLAYSSIACSAHVRTYVPLVGRRFSPPEEGTCPRKRPSPRLRSHATSPCAL